MSMKSHELQAAYVRRREVEHMRNERNDALSRYYDNFDKLNSRYANWSGPEYYQKAEERLNAQRQQKEKSSQLLERRNKLKQIISNEQKDYELEIKERSKPRARRIPATNEQLAEIERNLMERAQIKRKLEMEAKLYGRLRHGVDDENRIFEAKSDNEVLAKLNWLDKQIEDQMEREKEQAIAQDRKLRMKEEMRKLAETKKVRQEMREKEIKEIRALQERHMNELKERQSETSLLKDSEHELRLNLSELDKELELLEESSAVVLQDRSEPSGAQPHNLKRIKLVIRKRSEAFRQQIKIAINILERMRRYSGQAEKVKSLIEKCQDDMHLEECIVGQIEGMYDSEAKYSLQQLEAMWRKQHNERYQKIKDLIKDEQSTLNAQLNDNMQRQSDIIEVRSTHLSSIESSNEKLKQLVLEEHNEAKELDDDQCEIENLEDAASTLDGKSLSSELPAKRSDLSIQSRGKSPSVANVTNSFTNLNMDGTWQDLPSARRGIDSARSQSSHSMSVVTAANVEKPKFARKRVAWT